MTSALNQVSKSGKLERKQSVFRDFVEEGSDPSRYALYVSKACPWATRTLQFLKLKGIEMDVLSVHPTWRRTRPTDPNDSHAGWHFLESDDQDRYVDDHGRSYSAQGCTADTLNGCKTMRDLYDLAEEGNFTRSAFTTPVLWDKVNKTIVNNESSEICRMLNTSFNGFASKDVDLYPAHLEDKISELEKWIYSDINNGVYKCGFCQSQEAYDEAVGTLYEALDRVEEILGTSRYLCGSSVTGVDIWLINTLVRFDPVYVVYFKCSRKCIREYHNISNYVRDLYQIPESGSTIDFWNIRTHYFTSHNHLNPFAIVPTMPDFDYNGSHDRAERFPQ